MQSYRHPGANFIGTPNFTLDRDGHDMAIQPSWVVLHTMVGSTAGAAARFAQASEQASATYGVLLDGSLHQWVDEKDAAWANGNTGTGGVGDNLDSISIEHEDAGDFNGPRTPVLYNTSAALVRDVCLRYGIPIDRQHVIGHRECTMNAPTACPDALDVDWIARAAASGVFDRGATMPIEDRVDLATAVQGRVFTAGGAPAYHWESLPTVNVIGSFTEGQEVSYTQAVKVGGKWYDRAAGSDMAILDDDLDTAVDGQATDPAWWRTREAPAPPPAPPAPPSPAPNTAVALAALLEAKAAIDRALKALSL